MIFKIITLNDRRQKDYILHEYICKNFRKCQLIYSDRKDNDCLGTAIRWESRWDFREA